MGVASLLRPSRPGTAAWGCPGAGSPRPSRRRLGRGVPVRLPAAGHGGAGWAAGPPFSGAPGVPRALFYFSWISCENKAKSRSPRGWRAERGGGSRERRLEAADLDREAPEVTAPGAGGAAPFRSGVGGIGPVLSPGLSSVRWAGCSPHCYIRWWRLFHCGCCGSLQEAKKQVSVVVFSNLGCSLVPECFRVLHLR